MPKFIQIKRAKINCSLETAKSMFKLFKYCLVGKEINLANRFTTNDISDFVQLVGDISAPIALKYGTLGSIIFSPSSFDQKGSIVIRDVHEEIKGGNGSNNN